MQQDQTGLTPEQIEALVNERYPPLPREWACDNFKQAREDLRELYRQRLREGLPKISHSDS